MKNKILLALGLLSITSVGCSKVDSPTFSYLLDEKEEQLHPNEMIEQLCYEEDTTAHIYQLKYDQEYKEFYQDYDHEKDTGKSLKIYDVSINDDIYEVIQKANIEKNFAKYDYEYDPYHDGCTEINNGIYDGTIINFEEIHVLDYVLQQRYDLINDEWIIHNYLEDPKCNSYVIIQYTFSGTDTVYSKQQGKLMALSITYIQER